MTITAFNKIALKNLRPEIDAALKAVADKHGIELRLGNISFTEATFTAKVEGKIEALADEAARKLFLEMAEMYGLDPEKISPDGYRLVGFEPKKRSKPWKIEKVAAPGPIYVIDDIQAEMRFKKAAPPAPLKVEPAPARADA